MVMIRLYTGDDGHSHFEDLDPIMGQVDGPDAQKATGITFRKTEPGTFMDWHVAPRRQYVITLVGQAEIGIGDGTVMRFGPGDVMLADDLTGKGHTTRAVGKETRISVAIPVE
jgi:quercetin dioxygenase-like cupin family protein